MTESETPSTKTQNINSPFILDSKGNFLYVGVYFSGDGFNKFWQITCPCGVMVEYPVNGLPEIDTPHPCGNPDHWTVKFQNPFVIKPGPAGQGKFKKYNSESCTVQE